MPTKNKQLRDRAFRQIIIKESFGVNPKYIVAELAFSADKLKRMRAGARKRIMAKAERLLRCSGADDVLLTDECKELFLNQSGEDLYSHRKSRTIPCSKLTECFMIFLKKTENVRYNRLVIYDENLSCVSFDRLADICGSVRYITLYTGRIRDGERIAEALLGEYGILISVQSYDERDDARTAGMLIDAENRRVRIGDFVIDGAEFASNAGNYRLDAAEMAACMDDECCLDVKNWLSRENVIRI